ncbi:MAG: acyltransferase, partial [Ilumatobacter sp.]|nr:acyltransferase [Ilumatobacter sp.]
MRELELDGLRAIALGRVVLWHTFAAAWITWVVSAVPAMFFVTGSLLAASLLRRPSWAVVRARARRLLVPLGVYSAVVLAGMLVLADGRGGPAAGGWWRWMVPLWDPAGPGWTDGWGSSHLWYLRAYLWVLLAAPFVWWAWRRRPGLVTAASVVAFAAVEVAPWSGALAWRAGDLLLYVLFTIGGFWHRVGAFRTVRPGHRLAAGLLAFTGAGVVVLAVGMPPGGVVNDDHLLHLLMGAGWLAVIGAFERPFTAWCTRPRVADVLAMVSRRSLTIYLWHPLAIVLGYWVLDQVGRDATGPVGSVVLVMLVVAGTLVAVAAVGWVEDIAARRSPGRGPRPVAVVVAAAVAAAAVVVTPAASAAPNTSLDVALPRAPSRAPEALVFDDAAATTSAGTVPGEASSPAAGALASWGPEG